MDQPEVQRLDENQSPNFANLDLASDLVRPEGRFFTPSLHDVSPPEFCSPDKAEELVHEWKDSRLLVLGGTQLHDKAIFARHLAWSLAQNLRQETLDEEGEMPGATELPVLQWFESNTIQHVEQSLARSKQSVVFVFTNVQIFHFGHDLGRFLHHLERHRHFAILTTLDKSDQWELALESCRRRDFWHDLETHQVYTPEYLEAELKRQLEDARARWPAGLFPHGISSDALLAPGTPTLREVALQLESPGRLRSFVLALTSNSARASAPFIEEQLLQLAGDGAALKRWYRQMDVRQQQFTLGLALLDGLFDDQAFAGLETLVNTAWRDRIPDLVHFDYADLSEVGAYFLGTRPSSKAQRISIPSAELRRALFQIAWLLHRRTIKATLPFLAKMLVDSTKGPKGDDWQRSLARDEVDEQTTIDKSHSETQSESEVSSRLGRWVGTGRFNELFGTPERQQLFRQTLAETLGELGLIGGEAIEGTLLKLAQHLSREVQATTALALAHWRQGGNDEALFDMLGSWLDETRIRELFFLHTRSHRTAINMANVRATVALAIGFASLHDPPNRLQPSLVKLFQQVFQDLNALVIGRFHSFTLPAVLTNHLQQMESWVRREIMKHPQHLLPTAQGMAFAVATHPQWACPILLRWYEEARARPRLRLAENEISEREGELWVVIMALGLLPAGLQHPATTSTAILDRLRILLQEETHPFLRKAIFAALARQIGTQEFRTLVPYLRQLMAMVAIEERGFVVGRLHAAHLAQWAKLPNGDGELDVGGVIYPVFRDSTRPKTAVERVLEAWIQDPQKPAVQQLALEAYSGLGELEVERRMEDHLKTEVEAPEAPPETLATRPRAAPPTERSTYYASSWLLELLLWFVAPWNRLRRQQASAPLAQALSLDLPARRALLESLEMANDDGLNALARDLHRALSFHRRRRAVLVTASLCLLVLVLLGLSLGGILS